MFVSVHFPKSGGTSLRVSLEKSFGSGAVHLNYADDPVNPVSRYSLDPAYIHRVPHGIPDGAKVVHGHFTPRRYLGIVPCDGLFTFLREPVENLISIYFFWKSFPRNNSALHTYFLDHNLTIEETAGLPALRRLFTGSYFPDFDMSTFDLIGDVSTYPRDLARLGDLLGRPLEPVVENVNRLRSEPRDGGLSYDAAIADAALRARLEDILAEDLKFYASVMTLRENLRTV